MEGMGGRCPKRGQFGSYGCVIDLKIIAKAECSLKWKKRNHLQ